MRLVLTGFIRCSPLLLNSWEHVFSSIETVKSIPFFQVSRDDISSKLFMAFVSDFQTILPIFLNISMTEYQIETVNCQLNGSSL
jgi:hypothetical protein